MGPNRAGAVRDPTIAGPPPSARFHDFDDFERLVEAARKRSHDAYLVVLLGGEAGLRCGEIAALEWGDVDLKKRQLCIQRTVWKGHTASPKGGRLRYVPMTQRLAAALHTARHLRGPRVFCDQSGKPHNEKIVADHVDHSARAAKLKHRGVHVLRHHADCLIMPTLRSAVPLALCSPTKLMR